MLDELFGEFLGDLIGDILGVGAAGAAVGVAGKKLHEMSKKRQIEHYPAEPDEDPFLNLLMAQLTFGLIVAKADGFVEESELRMMVEATAMMHNLNEDGINMVSEIIRAIMKQNLPKGEDLAARLAHADLNLKASILMFLYLVAHADGKITDDECRQIDWIAYGFGCTTAQKNKAREIADQVYTKQFQSTGPVMTRDFALELLQLNDGFSPEQLEVAIEKQMVKYNPATLQEMGADFARMGEAKMQQLKLAYDYLKSEKV